MTENTQITTTSSGLEKVLKKHSLLFTILYTILLCVLCSMLLFSYFSIFTSNFYLKSFDGKYLVGVVDTTGYNNTNSGQMLHVSEYANVQAIEVGDEVYFSGNIGEGSGIVQFVKSIDNYVVVKVGNNTKNIPVSAIIGKIDKKTNFWGYILWFFSSVQGVIALNIAIVILVVAKFLQTCFVETTPKGRELQKKLREQKKKYRNIRKMYKNYASTSLDAQSFEILAGEYEDNLSKLKQMSDGDVSQAYNYLLTKVHRTYVVKSKLSNIEKIKITNCIELMCQTPISSDEEYKLTDLILHCPMVGFDQRNFISSCKKYLNNMQDVYKISNLEMVLYVLLKQNKELRNKDFYDLIVYLENILQQKKNKKSVTELENLAKSIKNLIKFSKRSSIL